MLEKVQTVILHVKITSEKIICLSSSLTEGIESKSLIQKRNNMYSL